jgi:integrase/recombinase XerD
VRARHTPVRDKRARLVMTEELVALGMQLMASAETQPTPRLTALAFRDGLVIAVLALRPLRRKNLAGLIVDDTLQRAGNGWVIRIPPKASKTKTSIEYPWPEVLVPALTTYLAMHRPCLAALHGRWAAPIGNSLWLSAHGSPMTQMALYDVICARTRAGLGRALNPHLFRDAGATTMAVADPGHVRLASSLLGHRTTSTTERHYQQAQSLDAHKRYLDIIK